ncbi:hypothetical protein WI604_03175 [Bradyrhizobium symbiodeficiens]|uniref:hypothetical protein n=1 Tax=Bradyrhizobium symbiodeficiens TaxID=1404367 RepID=UPI0030D36307
MQFAAELTLTKARHFLCEARRLEADSSVLSDRVPFSANLEAAIVYARAAIEHLHQEFAPKFSNYRTWRDNAWRRFNERPTFAYLYVRRNFILHQAPEETTANVGLEINTSIQMSVALTTTITRADGSTETRESGSTPSRAAPQPSPSTQKQTFFFVDPNWSDKPALEYVEDFISLCESFVADAKREFT